MHAQSQEARTRSLQTEIGDLQRTLGYVHEYRLVFLVKWLIIYV